MEFWQNWRSVEAHFGPDPRAAGVLELLIAHNPARLTGDVRLEYQGLAKRLPKFLDMVDSFQLMYRAVWQLTLQYIPPHLVGEQSRYEAISRTLWEQWSTSAVVDH
jgi:hypothetical protein